MVWSWTLLSLPWLFLSGALFSMDLAYWSYYIFTLNTSSRPVLLFRRALPNGLLSETCWTFLRTRNGKHLSDGARSIVRVFQFISGPALTHLRPKDSDIIHLNVFGASIIILNSVRAISDLMEKRSLTYSGRSVITIVSQTHMSLSNFFTVV